MKTTKLYNVLSKNATVLATYAKEAAAVYELNTNPRADSVVCANTQQLVAPKPHAAMGEKLTVIYASPYYRDEYAEQWLVTDPRVEKVLEAARRRARKNYLVFAIVGEHGTVFQI